MKSVKYYAPFPLRDLPLRATLLSIVFLLRPLIAPLRSAPPDFRVAPLTCSDYSNVEKSSCRVLYTPFTGLVLLMV